VKKSLLGLLLAAAMVGFSGSASGAAVQGVVLNSPGAETKAVHGTSFEPFAWFLQTDCFSNPAACINQGHDSMMVVKQTATTGYVPANGNPISVTQNTSVKTPSTPGKKVRTVCTRKHTACRTYKGPQLIVKCTKKAGRTVCIYYDYNTGKAYKRCVTKRGRRHCVRLGPAPKTAADSVLNWQGFPTSIMPQVGELISIYSNNKIGTCTATVVTRGLLITAGHCIFNPELKEWPSAVGFIPGMSFGADASSIKSPWGVWRADKWWTTSGWSQSLDFGLDMAIVEVPQGGCVNSCPSNANGQWIGDVVGAWSMTANISYGGQAPMWIEGYPSQGYWSTDAGGHGHGQWACDTTYDNQYTAIGSGYQIWDRCSMNQGASGGPWFVKLNDGSWTIGAVSSMCQGQNDGTGACHPYGDWLRGLYFNENFLAFWHSVAG
jgi:hypothetical protein